MTPAIPRIAVQSSAAPPRVGGESGSPPCPRIGEAWPSSAGQSPVPSGALQNTAQQSGPVPISPWPKSIRGLWALENLRFSRELRSRHLIREVQQAVCPQPVISPCPKSIRGLWALENLRFSRELCSQHLIREVQQAVCPQPVISPCPKSIRGLWALENLRFSRELCSQHLIREVQQAVCPQPVRPQPAGRRRWPAPPNRCREGDSVPPALPSTRPPPSDHWADPKSLPTRRHRPPVEEFLSTCS
jgi:hypothetical protein